MGRENHQERLCRNLAGRVIGSGPALISLPFFAGAGPAFSGGMMPGKSKFTAKQDREAKHIAQSEMMKHPGMPMSKAMSMGYATVNKQKAAKKRGK